MDKNSTITFLIMKYRDCCPIPQKGKTSHLVNGFCVAEHNEGKSSRPACVGVCLDVYALNVAIFTEVFPQLLCGEWRKGG